MNWTTAVLIICCLLAVFAVWKEVSRAGKSHLLLRILASLLCAVALACIILPFSYHAEVSALDDRSAILLTPGFEQDSLIYYKSDQIFTANKLIVKNYPKAKLIRLDELKTDGPAFTKVHVFGDGMNENELRQLDHLPLVFHSSPAPGGVATVNWNQHLKSGESLIVQGKYNNQSSKSVKIILTGLSTELDSAVVAAKTYKEFQLAVVPKNDGRAVYHLLAIAGTDTLENQNLPVEISKVKPLKILMLSASPDFETRFLKNWLSESSFQVAVRSTISKDKFSSEYIHMQPVKLEHLSPGLLQQFDLVIGDLSALKSEASLKQAVLQKGLGLIIRADSLSKGGSWLQNDFPLGKLAVKNPSPVALTLLGRKNKTLPLRTDQTFIEEHLNTQTLAGDAQSHIFVSSALAGAGRLVFINIVNTFNWVLTGDQDDYSALWSLLIQKAARKASVSENWSVTQLPTVNEPIDLQLQSSALPGKIISDNSVIAPAQNLWIPFEWSNTYWPGSAGWHTIRQGNGQPQWYYIYGNNDWLPLKAYRKLAATRRYAQSYPANDNVTKQIHEKKQIQVPKIYFYLLLLVACGYLWVEGKLRN